MKTRNAVISLSIRNKRQADGTYPIVAFVSFKGRVELSTGVSISKIHWDPSSSRAVGKCPNSKIINQRLSDIVARLTEIRDSFISCGREYTAKDIKDEFLGNGKDKVEVPQTFSEVAERMIQERGLKDSTAMKYREIVRFVGRFCDGMLESYTEEVHLRVMRKLKTLKPSTAKKNAILIKALLTEAKRNGWISGNVLEDFHPSDKFHIQAKHRSLTKRQMNEIREVVSRILGLEYSEIVDIRKGIDTLCVNEALYCKDSDFKIWETRSLLIFYFGYLCGGPSFVDLIAMRWEDLRRTGSISTYETMRSKTGHPLRIVIDHRDPVMCAILEWFRLHRVSDTVVPMKVGGLISYGNKRQLVNKGLHSSVRKMNSMFFERGGYEAIPEDLTYYTARHSFASIMVNSGADIANIANMMGRSIEGISVYIKHLGTDEDVALMKRALI